MTRIEQVFEAIDAANALDTVRIDVAGKSLAANLVYGQRMSRELDHFAPGASPALRIAARGQHIERWIIPRSSYPMDKPGYFRWRSELKEHHARRLGQIMRSFDFEDEIIERVGEIVRKRAMREDAEVQTLEDVVCIVFLKHEIEAFVEKHRDDRAKLSGIIAKTWGKMSERGHTAALAIPPSAEVVELLQAGLAG